MTLSVAIAITAICAINAIIALGASPEKMVRSQSGRLYPPTHRDHI